MSDNLLLSDTAINTIVSDVSQHYRRFKTESGRPIWQPSPQLKILQYWVVDFLRSNDNSASEYATAYERGCSILQNAKRHEDSNHVLRMDVRHFFPSVGRSLILPYLNDLDLTSRLTNDDIELIFGIVLLNGGLTIGAPSSPIIANRAMIPFDLKVAEIAESNNPKVTYTRYSDDLFFSSRSWIDGSFAKKIESMLHEYGLEANPQKTKFLGSGSNKMMAGVAINHEHKTSLGQKRKALLRQKLYSFMLQDMPSEMDAHRLLGFITFAKFIEPNYVNKMLVKYSSYGDDVMLKIAKALKTKQH